MISKGVYKFYVPDSLMTVRYLVIDRILMPILRRGKRI